MPGSSGNPSGRPGRKAFREHLRTLIGANGELAAEGILAIAEGRTTYEQLVRRPFPDEDTNSAALIPKVTVVPTMRERLDAWQFLYEQLNGKASIEIDTTRTFDLTIRNYSTLTDEELAAVEAGLVKAERALPEDTVEGEVVSP